MTIALTPVLPPGFGLRNQSNVTHVRHMESIFHQLLMLPDIVKIDDFGQASKFYIILFVFLSNFNSKYIYSKYTAENGRFTIATVSIWVLVHHSTTKFHHRQDKSGKIHRRYMHFSCIARLHHKSKVIVVHCSFYRILKNICCH
mgnify:CR=1 FL=1